MASKKDPAAVDEEPVLPQKESLGSFFFNKKEGTVLGRTASSWAKIGLFYCIYYGCLVGWFAGMLHGFYSTLNETAPGYYGNDSLPRGNPGLGIRPVPIADLTLIRFAAGIPSSYQPYTQHLKAFFESYENASGSVDCTGRNSTWNDACIVNTTNILANAGCTSSNDYGYFEGQPCVVVKLNKLFDFVPVPFDSEEAIKADQEQSISTKEKKTRYKDVYPRYMSFSPGNLGISCDGHNNLDRTHIQDISFFPENGIDMKYFPYLNQRGYRSPIVVFKFNKLTRRELIQVTCKAWAWNIDNSDGQEKRGSVHFELLVD